MVKNPMADAINNVDVTEVYEIIKDSSLWGFFGGTGRESIPSDTADIDERASESG